MRIFSSMKSGFHGSAVIYPRGMGRSRRACRTLVPVFGRDGLFLATVDIGISRTYMDQEIKQQLLSSAGLFLLFMAAGLKNR